MKKIIILILSIVTLASCEKCYECKTERVITSFGNLERFETEELKCGTRSEIKQWEGVVNDTITPDYIEWTRKKCY